MIVVSVIFGVLIQFFLQNNKQDILKDDNFALESKKQQKVDKESCLADDCLLVEDLDYPAGVLSSDVQSALYKAIQDEYKARAMYNAVIDKFGLVRPFSMIIRAEDQHISSLKAIYDKYDLEVPAEEKQNILLPETLKEVCEIGVQAEIDNAKLYKEELLPIVLNYKDITSVFTNLMNASQEKHLPAFSRCAS